MRSGLMEPPDEDDQGNRYCLDCGEAIPQARVDAVQAVRCVGCAEVKERGRRLARMRGGRVNVICGINNRGKNQ